MRRIPLALAGILVLLAGCSDDLTHSNASPDARREQGSRDRGDRYPGERAFRVLSGQVPAFAGFYLNPNGQLVVRLTDLSRGEAMRAALVPVLQQLAKDRGNPNARLPRFVFERADYSFAQLSGWRERLEPVFEMEQVRMLDVDEMANRIAIGLSDESGRGLVESKARELGVPLEALRVTTVGEARSLAGRAASASAAAAMSTGCAFLTDYCRPLRGGIEIRFIRDESTSHHCTLGYPAIRNGVVGFVTAAHCSDDEWNMDNTVYYQPTINPGNSVGAETVDPNGWGFWDNCEFAFVCRRSDANFVQANGSTAVDVGYITRTTGPGSLYQNSLQPRFAISGSSKVYGGETVHMMGITTGWLHGTVTQTCAHFKKTYEGRWHKVLCSDVHDADIAGGDSGGPVFLWNGTSDNVTLIGVNFARNGYTADHSFFSPINQIQEDLGAMEVRAPEFRSTGGGGGSSGGGSGDCGSGGEATVIVPTC
jgi:hypothetical protein